MSVKIDKVGNNAVATITVDISDITALVGVSNPEKKSRAVQRLLAEAHTAADTLTQTDAQLDQQAADAAARAAALKAARPTGSL